MHPYPTTPRPQFAIRHHVLPQFPTAASACSQVGRRCQAKFLIDSAFAPASPVAAPRVAGGRKAPHWTGRPDRSNQEAFPPEEVEQSLAEIGRASCREGGEIWVCAAA